MGPPSYGERSAGRDAEWNPARPPSAPNRTRGSAGAKVTAPDNSYEGHGHIRQGGGGSPPLGRVDLAGRRGGGGGGGGGLHVEARHTALVVGDDVAHTAEHGG